MEMLQTHCYATGTVRLLWKRYKLTVMQQALLRYYGNAIKDLTCHNIYIYPRDEQSVRGRSSETLSRRIDMNNNMNITFSHIFNLLYIKIVLRRHRVSEDDSELLNNVRTDSLLYRVPKNCIHTLDFYNSHIIIETIIVFCGSVLEWYNISWNTCRQYTVLENTYWTNYT
jgi:hypothetical protein